MLQTSSQSLLTTGTTMHGTSGQYRLDMKRDDARTLMLKMDARFTFAGRERNVVLQLEGERQMKHIEWQRQVNNAEFKRQEKKMRQRMEFFQSLAEENKFARQMLDDDDVNIFETEIQEEEATRRRHRKLPPVKRKLSHLDRPDNVGSVRREQKTFSNAHHRFLNRSLNELNKSYKKQQTQKDINNAKLKKIRDEIATIGRPKPSKEDEATQGVPELQVSEGEPTMSRSSKRQSHVQTHKSLPELPKVQEEHLTPEGRRMSMSQRLAGKDFDRLNKLPGITVSSDNRPPGLGGNKFYMDTSHSNSAYNRGRRGSLRLVTLNKPKAKPKKEKPQNFLNGIRGLQSLPAQFYEGIYEENPFLTPDFKPEAIKVRSKSGKKDEMYAWLGLDSMDELVSLRGESGIGVGKDVPVEIEEENMEWLEIASNEDEEDVPANAYVSGDKSDEKEKREKVVYTVDGKPAEFYKIKANPLKKFTRAAKTIMLIRKIQDSAGCLEETAAIPILIRRPSQAAAEQSATDEANGNEQTADNNGEQPQLKNIDEKGEANQSKESTSDEQKGVETDAGVGVENMDTIEEQQELNL